MRRAAAATSELEAAAATDPGRVRPHNEDTFALDLELGLLAVIDGMGGEAAGEVAAALAAEAIRAALGRGLSPAEALAAANAAIREAARRDPKAAGMGAVATVARARGETIALAHVGDTRAYLAGAVGCERLTRDHTAVAQAAERDGLSEAEARGLMGQHQVTRDLGRRDQPDARWVDQAELTWSAGDLLLLCSDGLHDLVREAEIFRLLAEAREAGTAPDLLVERLVALALERGGKDNVTVLVARRRAPARAEVASPGAPPPRVGAILAAFLLGAGAGAGGLWLWVTGRPAEPASMPSRCPDTADTADTAAPPWMRP